MATRKVNVPGQGPVEATEVAFRPTQEHWSEYHLDDGTTIRLKAVVTSIFHVPGVYDNEGNPVYLVNSQNVLAVNAPEQLMKSEDES